MKFKVMIVTAVTTICALIIAAPTGAYVWPMIGGSQVEGDMIMPEIWLDGTIIRVSDEYWQPWPVFAWSQSPFLRPLVEPNEFNPAAPWAVLTGKAYNWQYGWDSGLLNEYPPLGSDFWLKVLYQTPGLETYWGDSTYAPIFGTLDSQGNPTPDIWKWNMGMMHNVYAVPESFYGRLFATYKIYIGDSTTGDELVDSNGQPIYQSTTVTFRWLRPCLYILQGDLNADCIVDFLDFSIVTNQWLDSTCTAPYWCDEADIGKTGAVNMNDFDLLSGKWLTDCHQTPSDPCCSPRPGPW